MFSMFNRSNTNDVIQTVKDEQKAQDEEFRRDCFPTPKEKAEQNAYNKSVMDACNEAKLPMKDQMRVCTEAMNESRKSGTNPNPKDVIQTVKDEQKAQDEEFRRACFPTPKEKAEQNAYNQKLHEACVQANFSVKQEIRANQIANGLDHQSSIKPQDINSLAPLAGIFKAEKFKLTKDNEVAETSTDKYSDESSNCCIS